jgi:hypothetical protein
MDTLTLINALIEWAEWWHDTTGLIDRPELWEDSVTTMASDYDAYTNAEREVMSSTQYGSDTHAWFLLLIAADLETSL